MLRNRMKLAGQSNLDTEIEIIMADRLGDEFNTVLAQKKLVNHVINHLELEE